MEGEAVPNELCEQCGHSFPEHVFVAKEVRSIHGVEEVPVSGIVKCPEPGCGCCYTWDISGLPLDKPGVLAHFAAQFDPWPLPDSDHDESWPKGAA